MQGVWRRGSRIYIVGNITNILTGNTFSGNSTSWRQWGGAAYLQARKAASISTISNNTFSANTIVRLGWRRWLNGSWHGHLDRQYVHGQFLQRKQRRAAPCISPAARTSSPATRSSKTPPPMAAAPFMPPAPRHHHFGQSGGQQHPIQRQRDRRRHFCERPATLYMVNNTIFGNSSGGGGGGASFQVNGSVELLNVFNNIIWGNSANGQRRGCLSHRLRPVETVHVQRRERHVWRVEQRACPS